jgi:membrane associated rhomboid family serine protease
MAAALRFVFQRGGPLALLSSSDPDAYRVPAAPLSAMLLTPRALLFVAVWFGLNALFGAAGMTMPGMQGQSIAWQAHVGGFIAGLLLFSWFDPVREQPTPAKADMTNADAGPGSVAPEPSEK